MNLERDRNVLFIILLLNCFIINTQISISNEEIKEFEIISRISVG